MGHVHKIAISISGDVLERLNEVVQSSDISRSRHIQVAVERYLKQLEFERIQAKLDEIYSDEEVAAEQLEESEALLTASPIHEDPW